MYRSYIAMAFRSSPSKVTAYCANIRQMASGTRAFSTEVQQQPPAVVYVSQKEERQKWQRLLLHDEKFPFKGTVTSKLAYDQKHKQVEAESVASTAKQIKLSEILNKRANDVKREATRSDTDTTGKLVELKAMECPKILKKDLFDLFHGVQFEKDVSVLNLTHQTEHDMSVWSFEMELERLQLTSGFIESALAICNALAQSGYWADFIDPSSGRPYLGKYTNATLMETDDRYRSLGFTITDLGCCKVLGHVTWGANAFVGTIFTNAPVNCPAITEILAQVKE